MDGIISFGKVVVVNMSLNKDKCKGFNGERVICVVYVLSHMILVERFIKTMEITSTPTLIYKDTMNTIHMEVNSKMLSGQSNRHINISCFFVRDNIEQICVKVHHFSTNEIVVDYNKCGTGNTVHSPTQDNNELTSWFNHGYRG